MTSKKSSVNTFAFTFWYTIKKNCWLPVLCFLYSMFFHLGKPVVEYFNKFLYNDVGIYPREILYTFYDAADDFFGFIFNAVILIAPLVLAAMIFRFMMNKSAVNVFFSVGVTRTTMFWAKFSAGAAMLLGALIIPLILSLFFNILFFGSSVALWQTFVYILVNYITLELFIFSIAVATFSIVGTVIEGIAFSAVYTLSPFVFEYFIQHLFKTYVAGSPETSTRWSSATNNFNILGVGNIRVNRLHMFNIEDFLLFPYSSTMRLRSSVIVEPDTNLPAPNYTTVIFWAVVTAAIMLFAWYVYKNRKAEIAGFMGAAPRATFFAVFVASTFISSVILPELIFVSSAKDKLFLALFTALVFAAVYIVVDVISLRSFRLFVKKLWKYPLHLAIYFTFVIVFATGFFGYKTRIPEIDKIESVSISTETGDIFLSPSNLTYRDNYYYEDDYYLPCFFSAFDSNEHRLVGGFTDKADIERALDIHKKLIEISGETVDEHSVSLPYGERMRPVSIAIVYHLKDGSTFQRVYTVANDDILIQLSEFTKSEHYKDLALKALNQNEVTPYLIPEDSEELQGIYAYDGYSIFDDRYQVGFASPNFSTVTAYPEYNNSGTLKSDILEAISKDIEAGTLPLDLKRDSNIYGYILFKDFTHLVGGFNHTTSYSENGEVIVTVEYDGIKAEENSSVEITRGYRFNKEVSAILLNSEDGVTIPVYENMTNTVEFIKANGYAEDFVDSKVPYAVKIWNEAGEEPDNLYRFNGRTMLFDGMYHIGYIGDNNSFLPEFPDSAQVITDNPELVAEYAKKARMMYFNCYDGRYAEFLFADGSSTFAYIPQ